VKYRKKPVVVDAVQWTGYNYGEVYKLFPDDCEPLRGEWGSLFIPTLEGEMRANPGDWIIRGVAGECYPCKPEIFKQTYEPVNERSKQ
jgi:hypothetical protein